MQRAWESSPGIRFTLAGAAVVILLAGMKLASGLLSPILFAVFVAILCHPMVRWLDRKGLPTGAVLLLLILGVLVLGLVLTPFLLLSLSQLRDQLPVYQTHLAKQVSAWLGYFDIDATPLQDLIDPAKVINALTGMLSHASSGIVVAVLTLLGVVFAIRESARIEDKFCYGLGNDHPLVTQFAQFGVQTRQFFQLRTINNLIVAAGSAIFLVCMKVDFALLWAVLIFFLSYVPNIGIFIACVPAVALALIQHGVPGALVVAGGLTVINYVGDYLLTPRMMSQGLGLSQFAIYLSFFFWTYIFGAVGGLLSVPLTLLVKLLLEADADTRWLAALMADKVLAPPGALAGPPRTTTNEAPIP